MQPAFCLFLMFTINHLIFCFQDNFAENMRDFTIPSDNEEDSLSLEPNTSAFEDGPAELEYTIVPNGSQRGKPIVVDNIG